MGLADLVAVRRRSAIGKSIAKKKLDLRTSLAHIMSAIATGKAPQGDSWTRSRPADEEAQVTAATRRRVRVAKNAPLGKSGTHPYRR